MEQRLWPAKVPRLTHAELHEASQAMFNHLATALTVSERGTVLVRPGRLNEAFLRMQLNGSTALATHTLRA